MLESTRLRIGTLYARMRFRKSRDPVIRFTEAISGARRAVVFLPETPRDPAVLELVFHYLRESFHTSRVLIVARKEAVGSLPDHRGFDLLTFGDDDLNAWFIPRDELLRKMKKSTFDIAFDLNLGFALPSAFLCRASRARVRVGFAKAYADDFYNFQISTRQLNNLNQAYSNLFRCLEMF